MKRRSEPSAKLQIHIPAALKAEVERQAEGLGQSISTFIARTLSTAMRPPGRPRTAPSD
jgi:hypothetical protein